MDLLAPGPPASPSPWWSSIRFYAQRDGDALRPNFALLMQMRASAASHAAVNLALETADLAMPILVVSLLSASANASFYIAWMIAGFLVMVPLSLSMVAYAIGSRRRGRAVEAVQVHVRHLARVRRDREPRAAPGGRARPSGLRPELRRPGDAPLHILALGVFPLTFKTHYVAIHRVQRRLGSALPIVWGGTLLELGGGAARRDPGRPHRGRVGLARGPVHRGAGDGQGRDPRPLPDRARDRAAVETEQELAALTALTPRPSSGPNARIRLAARLGLDDPEPDLPGLRERLPLGSTALATTR